jgi:transposase InsO family protein
MKTKTCVYHPQGNGQVERFNRTLLAMLSTVVNENMDDWDDHLPYVMSAYRSSVHDSTGCTPNKLMLGRESTTPVDLLYPLPSDARYVRIYYYLVVSICFPICLLNVRYHPENESRGLIQTREAYREAYRNNQVMTCLSYTFKYTLFLFH